MEGFAFDEIVAGDAGHPVHLSFPKDCVLGLAGVEVIVCAARVFGAGKGIKPEGDLAVVEVVGYESFERCAFVISVVKEFVQGIEVSYLYLNYDTHLKYCEVPRFY